MNRFPNPRAPRLAGLESCCEAMHRRPPTWQLFARLALMGAASVVVGLLLLVVIYHAAGRISPTP